jgi:hypothetical protein
VPGGCSSYGAARPAPLAACASAWGSPAKVGDIGSPWQGVFPSSVHTYLALEPRQSSLIPFFPACTRCLHALNRTALHPHTFVSYYPLLSHCATGAHSIGASGVTLYIDPSAVSLFLQYATSTRTALSLPTSNTVIVSAAETGMCLLAMYHFSVPGRGAGPTPTAAPVH